MKNKVHQYSVSMLMMNIINSCIDIGNEIISLKLCNKLKDMDGIRTILAHEYG